MNRAIILLGSNEGDLSQNLHHAVILISEKSGTILKKSKIYETEPWGRCDQPFFYNQVIELSTPLNSGTLMGELLSIEKRMGRERMPTSYKQAGKEKWAPRIIDLDILYFNDEIINEPDLKIPHPHLHERRFTLVPLSELFPEMIHPVLKLKNKVLLAALTDTLAVKSLKNESLVKH